MLPRRGGPSGCRCGRNERRARATERANAPLPAAHMGDDMNDIAVFAQTNDVRGNELVTFTRDADGRLRNAGSYPTGGWSTGKPRLTWKGSIAVDAGGAHLIVPNAGSDELSYVCLEDEPVSPSVKNGRSEVSWASGSADGRFVYALDADAHRVFAY